MRDAYEDGIDRVERVETRLVPAVGTKGLSRLAEREAGGVGFLEGDQAARELEQGEVVLVLLRPADQERTVAVEPGVAGLDDPAAGTPARSV